MRRTAITTPIRGCRATVAATTLAMMLAPAPATARDGPSLHAAIGAPDALMIRASVRARTEAIDGQFHPGAASDDLLWSLRTDVFAEYDAGPIRIGGELRDARGYFQKRTSSARTGEINALEPLQAYLATDMGGVFGRASTSTLTAGRFTMDDGAGRLIAAPDFPNSIVSFTGVRFERRSAAKDRLMLFWTMPSSRFPQDVEGLRHNRVKLDRARGALWFAGGSFTKASLYAGLGGETYVYRLDERDRPDQATRDRRLLTYGVRLFRPPVAGAIDLDLEAARQTGDVRATAAAADRTDLAVDAGFVHAEIGRRGRGPWSPRVSIHADYASGDGADPQRYTRFDPLFGAPRADFGPTALYGAVTRANLVSGGARIDVAPSKRVDAFVMGRGLWLAEAADGFAATGVRDPRGRSGRYAGSQVEARVRYWMMPQHARLELGGAYLAKGRFLHDAPNAPATGDTRYAYLDATASF